MVVFDKVYRGLLNWGGDIKKINCFPYVTWATHSCLTDFDEILEALSLIKYGDIGLHRDVGYLSNSIIPGFMKHAWIHVQGGLEKPRIVEAVSEGVLLRNAIHPLLSDYSIILSPKGVSDEERKGACLKAESVVGAQYDVNFKFDIEEELKFYTGTHLASAATDLVVTESNLQKYMPTFSCTEVVGYSWWHKREELDIYRTDFKRKSIIKPDSYLNNEWEIKWASKSVTLDIAKKYNLYEEGLVMLEKYLGSK
jgi:hypothetical protein